MASTTVPSRTVAATRAWVTTTPSSSRSLYESPNADLTSSTALTDRSSGLDARDRIVLDPVNVNANGLTLRGVEFDYKTPRYHNYNVTLQTDVFPNHSIEVGYVGTRGRNLETFTGMNNVNVLAAARHQPGTRTWTGRISRWDRCSCAPWARARTTRCRPSSAAGMHNGLEFLVSYTLSDAQDQRG